MLQSIQHTSSNTVIDAMMLLLLEKRLAAQNCVKISAAASLPGFERNAAWRRRLDMGNNIAKKHTFVNKNHTLSTPLALSSIRSHFTDREYLLILLVIEEG
jgi:hypothetical protein